MANVYRIEILEERLRRLTEVLPSLWETVIVSVDGFVVAAYPPPISEDIFKEASTSQVAAIAASLIALGDQALNRLDQGEMRRLMIEGDEGAIVIYPINRSAALAVLVDNKSAKMGLTLHEIARTATSFAALLPE
ncbi:MAG: roadblock/LC7 domain-containing protein [Chloroflexi bacterium]|nr:roadblock/LC7 domain-containing protein [Chloroflexota bacterium]MDA0242401.1 roadblock/LC7 domain-containing protein [Chloroflexota bacterium]